jgi:uncharacterized protein YyaL (SSP411 family)
MAHESFEDPAIAALMNERFVSIKVDREERPTSTHVHGGHDAMTGHGGWPMTVFLDHDGGRSTPAPTTRPSRAPGCRVSGSCSSVSEAWRDQRDRWSPRPPRSAPGCAQPFHQRRRGRGLAWTQAVESCSDSFDAASRRFRAGAEVPAADGARVPAASPCAHRVSPGAVSRWSSDLDGDGPRWDVRPTGGGLRPVQRRRRQWLVPHFEKMLYDNALLLRVYLHWWRQTGSALARSVVAADRRVPARRDAHPAGLFRRVPRR